jgi:hypothetical protein
MFHVEHLHGGDFMEGRKYIESTRKYLEYLENHLNNIEKAWDIVKESCKDMHMICDDYLYLGIEQEIKNHDLSKFSQFEFTQYRDHFYPIDDNKKDIDEAFRHHIAYNSHHWQNWTNRVYAYSNDWMIDCTHMIVDWIAMGMTGKNIPANKYYELNKENIILPNYAIEFIKEIFTRVYPPTNLKKKIQPELKEKITHTGVHYEKYRTGTRKWRARVYHHGKHFYVGRYATQAEAIEAHKKYKEKLIQDECNYDRAKFNH